MEDLVLRCINCSLRLRHLRRQSLREIGENTYNVLASWISPTPITRDGVVCMECFACVQNAIQAGPVPAPVFGHTSVCFSCGISILRVRTSRVLLDSEERNVIQNQISPHLTCDSRVTPPQRVDDDSRSVTPITDPEDEEQEVTIKEEKVEIDPSMVIQDPLSESSSQGSFKQLHSRQPGPGQSQLSNQTPSRHAQLSMVIQDPLSESSPQGSFKQLHSHQPGAGQSLLSNQTPSQHAQPSTSTSEVVIKEEMDEDEELLDYKTMYYKLLEEVVALRNQQLYKENHILIETNKSIGKEMEDLIATNQKYVCDIQHLTSENQRLTEKNQSLSENIQYLTEKMQELTARNEAVSEENQARDRVNIFNDYMEKIQNLNEKIRDLAEENKSLLEKNKVLEESIRKYTKESRCFKTKNILQRKLIQRLKSDCNEKLETKSRLIKGLTHNLLKLKAVNARLQRSNVPVD